MLSYKPAELEELDELYNLVRNETSECLKDSLWKIGMTESAFQGKFKSVGQVFMILVGGEQAGFYWVEKREAVLHLHGIILRREFQGRGFGRRTLEAIEYRHGEGVTVIELGVYHFNHPARHLYEQMGYKTARTLDDVQFDIMRKPLINALYPGMNSAE